MDKYDNKGRISFIGLSNYYFDTSLLFTNLFVKNLPNIDKNLDELIEISRSIDKNISNDLSKEKIFYILSRTYYEYKETLFFIQKLIALKRFNSEINFDLLIKKITFNEIERMNKFRYILENIKLFDPNIHVIIKFYNLIKEVATDMKKLNNLDEKEIVLLVEKHIDENFGGLDYEIDIDFNIEFDDIRERIIYIKDILDKEEKNGDKYLLKSEILFKKIYNKVCKINNFYEKYQI